MNSFFDKNINSDFTQACELVNKDFSHDELISMLGNGNILQKQIAALKLDSINNIIEGKILINNLTGCDGKIREAVAGKINRLLTVNTTIAKYLNFPEKFADASIDINANICRYVIEAASLMKNENNFAHKYTEKIFEFINQAFSEMDKFIYRDKKYVINKQLFKLYWSLESLKPFVNEIPEEKLLYILQRASTEKEYTVREKAAQLLVLASSKIFTELINTLKNDENYYVRAVFMQSE